MTNLKKFSRFLAVAFTLASLALGAVTFSGAQQANTVIIAGSGDQKGDYDPG